MCMLVQCGENSRKDQRWTLGLLPWTPNLLMKEIKLQLNNVDPEFNSSGGRPATNVKFLDDDDSFLSLEGVLLDTLDGWSKTRLRCDDFNSVQDIRNSASSANAYIPIDEELKMALWKELVCNRAGIATLLDLIMNAFWTPLFWMFNALRLTYVRLYGVLTTRCAGTYTFGLRGSRSFQVGGKCLAELFQDLGVMRSEPWAYYQSIGRAVT
ncbi:hypothetical protein PV08_03950 [Exophiala spinifera]|uniref:Uncharacterized protein n=1 Tax=Exophiala spinifera TaxID=91928 RepID=A0A0D2BDR5_9EURO|nr:uncharacterized protein PV08_03950 [Exophiala spinifera]KIW16760.1 hypothetical protein PV08_03950 [Exophiala spinifera]